MLIKYKKITYCARSAFIHLGLWRKLYDSSLHHFTASQFVLKCAQLTFSSSSTVWLQFERGTFLPTDLG